MKIALSLLIIYQLNEFRLFSQSNQTQNQSSNDTQQFTPLNNKLRSFNLKIAPEDIATMNKAIRDYPYVKCDVTINYGTPDATTIKDCGCRYKGSGSVGGCIAPDGSLGKFSESCRKMSWKVRGDKYVKGQTIDNLERLNLLGMQADMALFVEQVGLETLRNLPGTDLKVPRIAKTTLYVNDAFYGIMDNVEDVSRQFVKDHYGANDEKWGLYKDTWPMFTEANQYPKAYKGVDRSDVFINLKKEADSCIASGNCDETKASQILDKYLNSQSFIDNMAVFQYLGNWDQFTYLFVRQDMGGISWNHNFYVYVDSNDKINMIPWDYTETLTQVCGFMSKRPTLLGYGFPNYSPLADSTNYCKMPLWYKTPESYDSSVCEDGLKPDFMGFPSRPFTCDNVGHLMAIAWKDRFFERIQWLVQNVTEEAYHLLGSTVVPMLIEPLGLETANGGFPNSIQTYAYYYDAAGKRLADANYRWKVINIQENGIPM